MRAGLIVLLISAAIAATCRSAAAAEPTPTFTYVPLPPNAVQFSHDVNGVKFSIRANGEVPVTGVVVRPLKVRPKYPGVLWVHWLGEPATSNRTEFLSDAQALAPSGVVSMLVDMPWSKPDWFATGRSPDRDASDTIGEVIALRRALDFFSEVAKLDPTRLAYVGHDFGAMDGALLLAVDDRPQFAVLMTPTLSFWEWFLLGAQPADPAAYVDRMSAFDLPPWLARGHQRATLLQFGKNDIYVSRATAASFRNAVPDRDRTFKMYDADHALDIPAAYDDRRAWLLAHFGLTTK
jgi:hypothetical protein